MDSESSVSNRGSVHSHMSAFSFEQSTNGTEPDKATSVALALHHSTDRLQSPAKSTNGLETFVKRNGDLERRSNEQNVLISALRSHIETLETELRSYGHEVPLFTEPKATARDTNVNHLTLDVPATKQLDQLQLPPRSADRLKTSPMKSPTSVRSLCAHSPAPSIPSFKKNNYSDGSTSSKPAPLRPNLQTEESEDKENTLTDSIDASSEVGQTTPVESISNVDWNATIEALKASTNDAGHDQLPTFKMEQKSQASTPYSGRISTISPMKSTTSSNNSQSPAPSAMNSSQTSFVIANPYQSSSMDDSGLTVDTPKSMTPVSPLKFRRLPATRRDMSPVVLNLPQTTSVMTTPTATPIVTPFVKSNLYDPYAGDFQEQKIHQDHNGLGGTFNDPYSTPSTPVHSIQDQHIKSPGTSLAPMPEQQQQEQPSFPTDVPLFVDPAYLNTVKPEIISTIHGNPSRKTDDPTIVIAAIDRQTSTEMWRFKKTISQMAQLDSTIRPMINTFSLPPLPEKAIFLTNLPVKVDMRRLGIRDYFATLFAIPNIPLKVAYEISRFMSLDVVNLLDESNTESLKEGWLLRRMKGLGNNWKARYCVVEESTLQVWETPQGPLLESIKLTNTMIGRQPDGKPNDDKSSYRHAFAIMEPKKTLKTAAKQIFCAETNEERDVWVNVLVKLLDDSAQSMYSTDSPTVAATSQSSYLDTMSIGASTLDSSSKSIASTLVPDDVIDEKEREREAKRNKKRSFFAFKKINEDQSSQMPAQLAFNLEDALEEMNLNTTKRDLVFQNELSQVLLLSQHDIYGKPVPSVLFRCLQFLRDKSAIYEEGLFRLSGSSLLIRQLREQFDKEYDVDFNTLENVPDINTVAGLLKLWLREFPSNILTKDLYHLFKESSNRDAEAVALEFAQLVKRLPEVNRDVLYALFRFLNDVIKNKDLNKMNLKNLCIVFSPTLNVAVEVIVPFLVDFKCVFEGGAPVDASAREVLDVNIPTF